MKRLRGELGVIESIDTTNYTCIVRTEYGLHYNVPIAPVFLSPNGQGIWFLPEVGTRVILGTIGPANRTEYSFILGAAFALEKNSFDGEDVSDVAEEETITPDFRNNRPVLNPGEIVLSSSDRNFIVMRKGGVIEVGATQVAKRFYIPLQNIIRDLSQIYEMQTSAGVFQMTRKESDLTWGKTKTTIPTVAADGQTSSEEVLIPKVPTELNLRVKEFESDEIPIISIDLGNVTRTKMTEDGDDNDYKGNIVDSRYTAFDESNDLAHLLARLNINNRVKIYIDKSGNYSSVVNGAEIHVHNGPRHEHVYRGNYLADYTKMFNASYGSVHEEIYGARDTTIGSSDKTSVGNPDSPDTTWTLASDESSLNTKGKIALNGSKLSADMAGPIELRSGTDILLSCDNLVISTMGSIEHIFAGASSNTILNSEAGPVAYKIINESSGEIQVHNSLGSVRLSAFGRPSTGEGGPGSGVQAEILIKPNGTITVKNIPSQSSVEVNSTGCALSTRGGEISIDNTGKVNVGGAPNGFGNGRVVTTLTHPVCFVTGAPIQGSTLVGAASAAMAPGPMTATSFTKDTT